MDHPFSPTFLMKRWKIIIRNKWKHFIIILMIIVTSANILTRTIYNNDEENSDNYGKQLLTEEKIRRFLNNARTENTKRIKNVAQVCRKYNSGLYRIITKPSAFKEPPTPQYQVFYFDKQHKISWCPIYKAASSSWLYNFALLAGYTDEEIKNSNKQLSVLVRERYPQLEYIEAEEILHNSLKFLVVRHPFERILSAYRDKLENLRVRGIDGTHHFYTSYGRRIVEKYRPGGNLTNARDLLRPSQYYWNPNEQQPIGIEPTFKEFVRYLISTDLIVRADDHWIPYYLYCTPCLLKYEIIGKVESMLEDQLFIIHSANIENVIMPQWRHKTDFLSPSKINYGGRGGKNVSEMAKIYFSQLSKQEIDKLYEVYKFDFELFDYSPREYYKFSEP